MPRNDDDDDDRHMPKYSGVRGQPYTTWIQAVQEWAEAEFLKDDDFSMHDTYTLVERPRGSTFSWKVVFGRCWSRLGGAYGRCHRHDCLVGDGCACCTALVAIARA